MLISQLQQRIAKQIVLGYLSLIVLTIVLYTFAGIIDDELTSLLTTLSAISALYIAPLFQFFSQSLRSVDVPAPAPPPLPDTDNLAVRLVKLVIPAHFILVGTLIFIKALNLISFKEMNIFLGFIETTFGTYMSFVVVALFKLEKHET
ncbi:hypothetical protein [Telluribacter sp. SYSU D00476]|uniref:hypothetical protein n=1 Tax=Telluribacter sp. SYSU D00476 TaxID=2811430 RepID=UPI001FF1E887|nr:hypothetical protein [Telluribacter sp. SYSU D00476]